MLKHLRRKFTLIYTITTGVILTLIILAIFCISETTRDQHMKENFSYQVNEIQFLFQKSLMMDTKQFLQYEKENHMVFDFRENGKSLHYSGYFQPKTNRSELIKEVERKAAKEGIFSATSPSSSPKIHSSIFLIKGAESEQFYGQMVVLPAYQGWQSMIVLKKITKSPYDFLKRLSIYLSIDIFGILCIFWFSRRFVRNTLQPVEEDQRKQKEFIAAASHELRSPLAVIKASTQAMLCSKEKQEQTQFADDVQEEIGRMSKLIDEMLLLASTETRSWVVKVEPFDLDNFMIEQYEKLLSLLSNTNKKLTLDLPDQMKGRVIADPNRLFQVLTILVENAAAHTVLNDTKSTDQNNTIELRVSSVKQSYQIAVIDHGTGISDEDKKHIFEKFYRSDSSRNSTKHYGLGLSIASELMKRMDGTIAVTDTQNGGTTFQIVLPIAKNM